MKLCIDKGIYSAKPPKRDISIISNRIGQQIEDTDIHSFAKQVIQPFGRSWTSAYFKPDTNGIIERTNDNWAGQTIFALDFDNGITLNEVLERCKKYEVMPAFAYSTFSSVDNNKFRVVFQNPFEIQDIRVRNVLQSALMWLFPECDKACKDCARLFYGGKELIYEDYGAYIDIAKVVDGMCLYLMENDKDRHSSNKIRKYCQLTGLDILNWLPKIDVSSVNLAQAPHSSNIYTYQCDDCARNSNNNLTTLFFTDKMSIDAVKIATQDTHYEINEEKLKRVFHRKFDFFKLAERCKLYRDFVFGEDWLYHNELFGLATNLLSVEGGQKRFTQVITRIEQYEEVVGKWKKIYVPYINKKVYTPQNCNGFCKHANECEHGNNMIETGKLPLGKINIYEQLTFKPLKEAEVELKQHFERIVSEDSNKVSVIKAPTGIGKTELYLNVKDATISVPRHNLKDDVAERMKAAGNTINVLPEVPKDPKMKAIIKYFTKLGQKKIIGYIYAKEARVNPAVANYLQQKQKYEETEGNCITTHERYLIAAQAAATLTLSANPTSFEKNIVEAFNECSVKKREVKNDLIIIDEDILPSYLQIDSMLLQDYYELCTNVCEHNSYVKAYYDTLEKTLCGKVPFELDTFAMWRNKAEVYLLKDNKIKSNVLDFFKAQYWRRDGNIVHYINRRRLADNKTIIFSATANEEFYRQLLGDRYEFIDLGHVKAKGCIVQCPQMSFSRNSLQKNKNALKFAKAIAGTKPVITFKDYAHEFPNCVATFGNLTGLDSFSNQDIVVVGTPHINPATYWLYAVALGMMSAEVVNEEMRYIPIKRNGMEFYFNTFVNNEILRNVQLQMVESELMQAIGRARILRNDCIVTVLSNYPIPGAEFLYLTREEVSKMIGQPKALLPPSIENC